MAVNRFDFDRNLETFLGQLRASGILLLLFALPVCPSAAPATEELLQFSTSTFHLAISKAGRASARDAADGQECLLAEPPSVLLRLKQFQSNEMLVPQRAEAVADSDGRILHLYYAGGVSAAVRARATTNYVTFELLSISEDARIELAVWGPLYTAIDETVGTAVGVVRDGRYALGLQALNVKTLGGYETGRRNRFGNTAQALKEVPSQNLKQGSWIQAFSRNRTRERTVSWGANKTIKSLPVADETVIGSKIALFGCPPQQVLPTIGAIEVGEGLPHPLIEGEWAKVSSRANPSKFIIPYSETNIDEAIALAREAGIKVIYQGNNPWKSQGHFELNPRLFPHGLEGLHRCVEKAERAGIALGAHSMSAWISPLDPYVTPRPHPDLALEGETELAADLEATTSEVHLADHTPVAAYRFPDRGLGKDLRTVRIDDELISYDSVSTERPWKLLNCRRGVHNTKTVSHRRSTPVARVIADVYQSYHPDILLLPEVAANLGRAISQGGLKMIDLDGLECCALSGHEGYGEELFAKTFYAHLTDKSVLNGASDLHHFHWHMVSNISWGEHQKSDFRSSMWEYRLQQLAFLEKNYIPKKIGQYRFVEIKTLADIEWLLARCAGYDAGFDLYLSPSQVQGHPLGQQILATIRLWLSAMEEKAFNAKQKNLLRDVTREFVLAKGVNGKWDLRQTGQWSPANN